MGAAMRAMTNRDILAAVLVTGARVSWAVAVAIALTVAEPITKPIRSVLRWGDLPEM